MKPRYIDDYQFLSGSVPDAILFYQIGLFYEVFRDVPRVAAWLQLTVTRRQGFEMVGVPFHSLENSIAALVKLGQTVAIAELPGAAIGTEFVPRSIVRVYAPAIEDAIKQARERRALAQDFFAANPGQWSVGDGNTHYTSDGREVTTQRARLDCRSTGATKEIDMSTRGNLTREQAIEIVGLEAVAKVEDKSCEPTHRVGYNGACQGDDLTEWSAWVGCEDKGGYDCTLLAYYYTTNEEDQAIADASDGAAIDWEIAGYEVA
jgi:hypothetical protein